MRQLLRSLARLTVVFIPLLLTASVVNTQRLADRYTPAGPPSAPVAQFLAQTDAHLYLAHPDFAPDTAQYYTLVNERLGLNADERRLMSQNGFVVSDRLAFNDFATAYAWIYWKDLPVLITTDSILQIIHKTYDDLLKASESRFLVPRLAAALAAASAELQAHPAASADPDLERVDRDLAVYLAVPLALLTDAAHPPTAAQTFIAQATAANTTAEVDLFGAKQTVDFTLFAPRGHYAESPDLSQYFRAVTWLSQADLRLVGYDANGQPALNRDALAAALRLREVLAQSGARQTWDTFDMLFTGLIGPGDNTTLADLDRFAADAGLSSPSQVFRTDADVLLKRLTGGQYGQQRITGHILDISPGNTNPLPRPVSFALLGARFTVDSSIMSNLVFDRLVVNGQKVQRPLPSPLDVMYALGSDRAAVHLQTELEQYGYQSALSAARDETQRYGADFWTNSFYNRWLSLLRALNADTTGTDYPQAMRTAACLGDKTLHTELASWAQLRHDNILYVKPVFTMRMLCQYPAGYVEPYPAFYQGVIDYARRGRGLFEAFIIPKKDDGQGYLQQTLVEYFKTLEDTAGQLKTISEQELRHQPLTADQAAFLKNVAVQKWAQNCGGVAESHWEGWYMRLLPFVDKPSDDNPALVADVVTNPNADPGSPLSPPGVLHVGTGPVAALILAADTGDGDRALYVGPSYTYFETIERDFPPVRLNDADWNAQLNSGQRPVAPSWTQSFRLWNSAAPNLLQLPDKP